MSACYKMYSIVQRVYPLTVDSLLSPGTLSIAFVILINYFTPKISNEIRHIYIYIYVGDEGTSGPFFWNFGKIPNTLV